MRIVASACLVIAVLLMVGCQQMTDQQKTDLGKIPAIEKTVGMAAKQADFEALKVKVEAIEKFLGDKASKFGGAPYGAVDTSKKAAPGGKTPAPAPATPAPKPEKKPAATKAPAKTK